MRPTRFFLLAALLTANVVACGGSTPPAKAPDDKAADKAPAEKAPADKATDAAPADEAPAEEAAAADKDDGDCKGQACITKCDAKAQPRNCFEAGEALRQGSDGVAASPVKAMKYLDKACTLKEREGCYRLADLYASGDEGIPQDDAKAVPLFTIACDLGRGEACDQLSKRSEKGQGMKKDHPKAIAWLVKGCAADDYQVWTCSSLKKAVDAKDNDAVKAVAAWKKACGAKNKDACANLDRLGGK